MMSTLRVQQSPPRPLTIAADFLSRSERGTASAGFQSACRGARKTTLALANEGRTTKMQASRVLRAIRATPVLRDSSAWRGATGFRYPDRLGFACTRPPADALTGNPFVAKAGENQIKVCTFLFARWACASTLRAWALLCVSRTNPCSLCTAALEELHGAWPRIPHFLAPGALTWHRYRGSPRYFTA